MKNKIKIFVTGGTIDCDSIDTTDKYIFADTHLPRMLEQGRSKIDTDVEVLMMKDSLLMNDDDRKEIAKKCSSCVEDRIIITHGTDTMPETARYLGERVKDKTIVLVGAIIPYNEGFSDSMFNLGTAIANVQLLPKGIYISMNGRVFNWDNVKKDKELGIFKNIF
jgi:L-asparaginase